MASNYKKALARAKEIEQEEKKNQGLNQNGVRRTAYEQAVQNYLRSDPKTDHIARGVTQTLQRQGRTLNDIIPQTPGRIPFKAYERFLYKEMVNRGAAMQRDIAKQNQQQTPNWVHDRTKTGSLPYNLRKPEELAQTRKPRISDTIQPMTNTNRRLRELQASVDASADKRGTQANRPVNTGLGNIDLNNRPVYRQPDGSISTVNSISFYDEDEKKEILVPTIVNGKQVSDDEAIDHYYKTGEYLGKFDTPEAANQYAEQLHRDQEELYAEDKSAAGGGGSRNGRKMQPFSYLEWSRARQMQPGGLANDFYNLITAKDVKLTQDEKSNGEYEHFSAEDMRNRATWENSVVETGILNDSDDIRYWSTEKLNRVKDELTAKDQAAAVDIQAWQQNNADPFGIMAANARMTANGEGSETRRQILAIENELASRENIRKLEAGATQYNDGEYHEDLNKAQIVVDPEHDSMVAYGDKLDVAYYKANNRFFEDNSPIFNPNNYTERSGAADPVYFMTDKQRETFNKYYNSGDRESAQAYLDGLEYGLLANRSTWLTYYDTERAAKQDTGWLTTVESWLKNPIAGAKGAVATVAGMLGNRNAANPNSQWWDETRSVRDIRGIRGEKWGEGLQDLNAFLGGKKDSETMDRVGRFLYGVVASMGDNLTAMGYGAALGGGAHLTGLVQAIMSSEAAGTTMLEGLEAGKMPLEAGLTAIAAGGIEAITEKYSIETLLKEPAGFRYILQNAFTEGTEEVASDVLNSVSDGLFSVIFNHKTEIEQEYDRRLQELMAANPNLDPREAQKRAGKDTLLGYLGTMGTDFLAGAVSGFGLSGGRTAIGATARGVGKAADAVGNIVNRFGEQKRLSRKAQSFQEAAQERARNTTNKLAEMSVKTAETKTASAEDMAAAGIREENQGKQTAESTQRNRATVVFDAESENGNKAKGSGQILRKEGGEYVVRTADGAEIRVEAEKAKAADGVTGAAMKFVEETGLDDETATDLLDVVRDERANGENIEKILKGAREMITKGYIQDEAPESLDFDPTIARKLYEKGAARAKTAEAARSEGASSGTILNPGHGTVEYRNVDKESLNGTQRAQVEAIEKITQQIGHKVIIENDPENKNRFGEYDPTQNAVIINLAGQDKSGIDHHMMVTMSHEMTHMLEHNSPEAYKELRSFVFAEIRKNGGNAAARIQQKMDAYNSAIARMRQRGEDVNDITLDGAVAEVVADACDQVLGNEKLIRQMAEEQPSLYQKVKDFVKDFIAKIRKAAAGMRASGSIDSLYMKNVDELAQKWGIALQETQNKQGAFANETSTTKTEPQFSVAQSRNDEGGFKTDKYYESAIDNFRRSHKKNGFTKVGMVTKGGALNLVGIPEGQIRYDNSKIWKNLEDHSDYMTEDILKKVPEVLAHPIMITEANVPNTVSVFGTVIEKGNPLMVAVMVAKNRMGIVAQPKVRTVNIRNDFANLINDDSILYITSNKKEAVAWSKARGINVPLGGSRTGLIRSIELQDDNINIKSGQNQMSLAETEEYMAAAENGDTEAAQKMVDQAADAAFKDSKVRDNTGKLMKVYHGTPNDFTVFDTSKLGGKNGNQEGYGIYLTDDPEITKSYGSRRIDAYADIKRPAFGNRKTVKKAELVKVIQETCTREARIKMEEEGYDSLQEALQDTWISNYVYTPEYSSIRSAYGAVADLILQQNDNDADIVGELIGGQGLREYDEVMDFYHEVLTPITGIDGIWKTWKDNEKGTTANIILAFDSSQIKEAAPVTRDDQGKIIPLSERFNTSRKDIRFSLSELDDVHGLQQELNETRAKIKGVENSEEYQAALKAGMKGDFDAYNKVLNKTKLADLKRKAEKLEKDIQNQINERNRRYIESETEEEKRRIEKSGLTEAEYRAKQAVKEFGKTTDAREAGYIIQDGGMLNFSGEKGKHTGRRGQDHRNIGTVYADPEIQGSKAMRAFMNDGNVRIMYEARGLDLSEKTEPTDKQYATIRRIAREWAPGEEFNIDFTNENGNALGSINYEGRISPDRIISDIKHFYQTGEIRQQSDAARFHEFSLEEEAPDANDWIMGLDPDDLTSEGAEAFNSEASRTLIRNYQAAVKEVRNIEAQIRENREKLQGAKGDEARAIRNRIQVENGKLERARKNLSSLSENERLGWIMRRAQNTMDAFMRGKTQEEVQESVHRLKEDAAAARQTATEAAAALDKLADREAKVIAMRYFDEGQLKQTAKELREGFGRAVTDSITNEEMQEALAGIAMKMITQDKGLDKDIERLTRRIFRETAGRQFGNTVEGYETDTEQEIRGDIVQAIFESVAKIMPAEGADPTAQQAVKNLMGYVGRMTERMKQTARGMRKIAEITQGLEERGEEVSRATGKLRGDLERAIRYYDLVNKKNQAQADVKQIEAITRQLESKAAKRLLEEQLKWAKRMETDKQIRKLAEETKKLRRKIHTDYSRMANLILNETDTKNIPEFMKPVAKAAIRMILENDASFQHKITGFDNASLQRSKKVLDAIDLRDGKDLDLQPLIDMAGGDDQVAVEAEEALEKMRRGIDYYNSDRGRSAVVLEGDKAALTQIFEGISAIYNMTTAAGRINLDGQAIETGRIVNEIEAEARKKESYREFTGTIGKAIRMANKATILGNMTPEYFFKSLKNNGLSMIFDGFHGAEDRYGKILRTAKDKISAIAEKHGYGGWDTRTKHAVKMDRGGTVNLTLEQMMSLIATWKREQSLGPEWSEHLKAGGFVFEEKEDRKAFGREAKKQTPIRVTEEDIARIQGMMTQEQLDYVDDMVGILSEDMAEIGNEASMAMYGIKKYKEGYYFPFQVWDGVKNKASNAGSDVNPTNNNRAAHQSFTKRRMMQARNAVMIGDFTNTCAKHINQMATYATMGMGIENMNRALNFRVLENWDDPENATERTLESLLEQQYGRDAMGYIRTFMKDLNGGAVQESSAAGRMLMSMFKKNAVGGSLSVALQQPLSYIRAATMINPIYLAEAVNPKYYKGSYQEMLQHSGVAVIKDMGRFDMNFSAGATDWLSPKAKRSRGEAAYQKVEDVTNALPEWMDQITWTRMWTAVKLEMHAADPQADMKSEEFLEKVGRRFNEVMRKTQVYDSVLVKSELMRRQDWFSKSVTAFRAEPTLTLNLLMDAMRNAGSRGGKKQLAAALATYLLSAIGQAVIKGGMGAGRTPDEKKTLAENFAYKFASSFLNEANPVALIPGYDNIITLLEGNDINDNAWGMIKTMGQTMQKVWNPPTGEDLNLTSGYRYVEDTAGQIAQLMTGVPAKNLMRDSRAIYNWFWGQYADRDSVKKDPKTGKEIKVPARANSGEVFKYQLIDQVTAWDVLRIIQKNGIVKIWDSTADGYYGRIYEAEKAGDETAAAEMREYMTAGKGKEKKTVDGAIASLAKKDGSRSAAETADWLLDNGYADDTSWITSQYKAGEISEAELRKLYKEHFPDKDPDSAIWSYYQNQYKEGKITEAEARKLYSKYHPKKDEQDTLDYFWSEKRQSFKDGKISEAEAMKLYKQYHPKADEQDTLDYFWNMKWQDYKDGKISETEAMKLYKQYHPKAEEKDLKSTFWNYAKDQYKDGKIGRSEAEKIYRKYYPKAKADDVWWAMDGIDFTKETGTTASGQYYRVHYAIEGNKSAEITKAVQLVMKHGKDKKGVLSSIESKWKETYLDMKAGSAEKVRLKDAMIKALKAAGYTAQQAEQRINGWKKKKTKD